MVHKSNQWDTCSWKGQFEKREVLSWKVRDEIGENEVGKFWPNM